MDLSLTNYTTVQKRTQENNMVQSGPWPIVQHYNDGLVMEGVITSYRVSQNTTMGRL